MNHTNEGAEEGVLGACLVDLSGDYVARCVDAGCASDWFAVGRHRVIWDAIRAVSEAGQPVDEIVVCQWLASRGQLEMSGGMGEINRIANSVESTANAGAWIDAVKTCALSRKLLTANQIAAERLKNGTPLDGVLAAHEETLAGIAEAIQPGKPGNHRRTAKLLSRMSLRGFDHAAPPPKLPVILTLAGHPSLNSSNLAAVLAGKSSGKTSTVTAMVASLIGPPGRDYLGFQGFNPRGLAIRYFDTEQSQWDFHQMQVRVLRRAGLAAPPPCFKAFHLKGFSTSERRQMVCAEIRHAHENGGILIAVIDGLVDLLRNFNDIEECTGLLDDLMTLTQDTGVAIVFTLHVNPGQTKAVSNDKGRGHIGTMGEQKSEVVFLLSKKIIDGAEEMSIKTKDGRHGLAQNPPRFRWSNEAQMLVSMPQNDGPITQKPTALHAACHAAFASSLAESMAPSELRNVLMELNGWGEHTARSRISDMRKAGILEEKDRLYYCVNNEA